MRIELVGTDDAMHVTAEDKNGIDVVVIYL